MPSLNVRLLLAWFLPIYALFFGELKAVMPYSQITFFISLLFVFETETGKKAFSFSAPSAWNDLQSHLKLSELAPVKAFRSILKTTQQKSFEQCPCFKFLTFNLLPEQ